MSVRDNLIAARALIDTPEKWTKGAMARNGCFCAVGALNKTVPTVAGIDFYMEALGALRNSVPPDFKGRITAYNDLGTTSHADIMALFDRAIEAAGDK